jgi:hypothetical protein
VEDVIENGNTGRISLHVKSRRTNPDGSIQEGPLKTYGIDVDALNYVHGGSLDSFLQWVKREHSLHTMIAKDVSEQVHALKGKTL